MFIAFISLFAISYVIVMSEPTHAPQRIGVGAQVSRSFGELICNPNPAIKCKHKCRIFSNVVEAIDHMRYKVMFDSGAILQCYSNNLHVELLTASLPPNLPPPPSLLVTHLHLRLKLS